MVLRQPHEERVFARQGMRHDDFNPDGIISFLVEFAIVRHVTACYYAAMAPGINSIICWDFDHTLFGFQDATSEHSATSRNSEFAGFGPRPGIEPVLERLARLCYMSDITTSGSLAYVTRALEATGARGILRHFSGIFPGSEISVGAGKLYQPVARSHGLAPAEAGRRMLVIGDLPDDEPADLPNVVFIRQPNGHLHDPRVVEVAIGMLQAAGNGDFSAGFQVIFDSAQRRGQQIPYGGLLAMSVHTTAICVDQRPPRHQRAARLGNIPTPTITLLELS